MSSIAAAAEDALGAGATARTFGSYAYSRPSGRKAGKVSGEMGRFFAVGGGGLSVGVDWLTFLFYTLWTTLSKRSTFLLVGGRNIIVRRGGGGGY